MTDQSVCVLGAGGHAKVVIQTLRDAGYLIEAIFDDDLAKIGHLVLGVQVMGTLADCVCQACTAAVIGIGDNRTRARIAQRFPQLAWVSAIHPSAMIAPDVEIGAGTVIFAGAVIQPGTVVGEHTIINTGATLDHDCRIGDFTHIAPGSHLAGHVVLEEGAMMGIGSVAVPAARIGAWAIVGAGGVVIKSILSGTVAVGVPARTIKSTQQEHTHR